jgi:hypothetical protein
MELEKLVPKGASIYLIVIGRLPVNTDIWVYKVETYYHIGNKELDNLEKTHQNLLDNGNKINNVKYKALSLQILDFDIVNGTTACVYRRLWYKEPKPLKILNRENNASNQDSENSSVIYDTITAELENDF